jgi:poly-gamma-glutamate synthesis protein (capsule biosynthesis protein)
VSLHFGKTMITAPDDFQRKTTRWLWDNTDVDLIVGCHAHVIQPIDHRRDRYVFYGLGNHLATYPGGPITTLKAQDGLLALVTIHRAADGKISTDKPSIIPTWVGRGDGSYSIYDARDFDDPTVPTDLQKQLRKSLYRTRAVVGDYLAPPKPR